MLFNCVQHPQDFLSVLYSFCMVDNKLSDKEEELLSSIATNIFCLGTIPRVHLTGDSLWSSLENVRGSFEQYALLAFSIEISELAGVELNKYSGSTMWLLEAAERMNVSSSCRYKLNVLLKALKKQWNFKI